MLELRPQIKGYTKIVEQTNDYTILECIVVAEFSDGRSEVLKTFYQTVATEKTVDGDVISLPVFSSNIDFKIVKEFSPVSIISLYLNKDFLMSQPTRGPNK